MSDYRTDRPYWCEICARKKECYGITLKPKCFVPTTDRKTEPQTCETCKHYNPDHEAIACERCLDGKYSRYEPMDEPQTEKPKIRKRIDKPFRAVWLDDDYNEIGTPQTERSE